MELSLLLKALNSSKHDERTNDSAKSLRAKFSPSEREKLVPLNKMEIYSKDKPEGMVNFEINSCRM